jgi:hypothetical protein
VSATQIRWWTGWAGVAFSTAISTFWAVWGAAENFHEGWYHRELSWNIGLMLVQYWAWMFIPMSAALVGLWRPWLGLTAHLLLALGAVTLCGL